MPADRCEPPEEARGERCECGAVGARDRIEAQNGLNDIWAGDPYPQCYCWLAKTKPSEDL